MKEITLCLKFNSEAKAPYSFLPKPISIYSLITPQPITFRSQWKKIRINEMNKLSDDSIQGGLRIVLTVRGIQEKLVRGSLRIKRTKAWVVVICLCVWGGRILNYILSSLFLASPPLSVSAYERELICGHWKETRHVASHQGGKTARTHTQTH